MNLAELKERVDFTINNLNEYEKPEDISVLITLSETSCGARASTQITHVNMGFDWEHGQFRIQPKDKLVRIGNTLSDVKPPYGEQFDSKTYYWCQRCGCKVSKDDKFCRTCGQKLK